MGIKKEDTIQASRMYFPFKLSHPKLTKDALHYFTEVVEWMKLSPSNTITLTGHTDNIGSEKANLAMGIRRVMVIREALINLGAPFSQIDVLSRGESQPIETNKTKEGRFKNRRVELKPTLKEQ